MYRSTLSNFLERLDPKCFVRIHRSAIVNTQRIQELRPRGHGDYTIVLEGGHELAMSRAYRTHLEKWLQQSL